MNSNLLTHFHKTLDFVLFFQLINEKITCPVKRYSAEEIEETILKHLDKVLAETGYLDQIENNIEQCLGVNSSNQKARKDIVKKAITKIDGEIESVFKLATSLKSGSAGSDLIQNKLEKLAEKKKEMEKGQPHFKKRLFGNLFNQLLVTENGIKVFYELEEEPYFSNILGVFLNNINPRQIEYN